MSDSLQLYILTVTDGGGQPKSIPFWWDGAGDEQAVLRRVIEENGDCVLGEEEQDFSLDNLSEAELSGPWAFQETSVINAENGPSMFAIPFHLTDKCDDVEEKQTVQGTICLSIGKDLGIRVGDNEVVAAEVWEDEFRVHVWPAPWLTQNHVTIRVEDNPIMDSGFVKNRKGDAKPGVPPATVTAPPDEKAVTLMTAPAGEAEQTVDPMKPKAHNDYSTFWVIVVPKLAEANKKIPVQAIKDMAKAAMAEAGNNAIEAYDLLRQKIEAAKPKV